MKKVKIYELRLLAWAGLMLVSLLVSMGIVELFISITNLEILNKPFYFQKTGSTSFSVSETLIFVLFFVILISLRKPFARWVMPIADYLEDKGFWLIFLAFILIGIAFYHFNS